MCFAGTARPPSVCRGVEGAKTTAKLRIFFGGQYVFSACFALLPALCAYDVPMYVLMNVPMNVLIYILMNVPMAETLCATKQR